ncbi:hypothetical protein PDN73_26145 [Bacillus cereus]|nr:hypothetical protein [Bacillus cereus]
MYYYEPYVHYGSIIPDYFFEHSINNSQLNNVREPGPHIPDIPGIPGIPGATSPPKKKGFENLLTKYSYNKPKSTKCKAKGPYGTWTWVPCIENEKVVTGVYFGFNYPANVTPEQETGILNCGNIASQQGYAIIEAGFGTGGILGALAAVPAANSTAREVLKKCLENIGLTPFIVKNTQGGIYTKRLN